MPVANCDDSGPGSLRDVLAHAFNGDHITFPADIGCNVVALTTGPIVIATDFAGQPFTQLDIRGPGLALLTIDGGGLDRVFVQDAGSDAVLTLDGITVSHGNSDANGGCVLAHGSLVLTDVVIDSCVVGVVTGDTTLGNTALRGGGIYAANAITLTNSLVTTNRLYGGSAYAYGGGAFAVRSITAVNSAIMNNLAFSQGGAAYGGGLAAGDRAGNAQATVTLTSSLVTNNTSDSGCSFCGSRGGGVWTYGNTTLTDGEISLNSALNTYGYGGGGGLYFNARFGAAPVTTTATGTNFGLNHADTGGGIMAGGDLTISGALLIGNVVTADGGSIELLGGDLTLSDSTVFGNAASRGAGIFIFGYGDASIVNSTISGNSATYGAAIGNTYGSLHIANSTVAHNHAQGYGGGIWFRHAYYQIDLESTIVATNVGGPGTTPDDLWPPGMTVTGAHNLVIAATGVTLPSDTLSDDPMLLTLDNYGGNTPTMPLAEGSPAIDAGSNPLSLANDQRGDGFVREYGAAPDIGAFELQPDVIFANGFD